MGWLLEDHPGDTSQVPQSTENCSNAGNLTVLGTAIKNNTAEGSGGGIYNTGTLVLTSSIVSGNSAGDHGGGGVTNYGGTATVTNSILSANSTSSAGTGGGGGGIANEPGRKSTGVLTVTGSTISGNSATAGGGVYGEGTTTITGSTISGNSASRNGGGFTNERTLTIIGSTVSGNSTVGSGGGGANYGTATLAGSTFSGNSAGRGAGLLDDGEFAGDSALTPGTAILTNTTFASNTASKIGGGIYDQSGALSATNVTITGNLSGGGSGIETQSSFGSKSITLVNTLVAGNILSYSLSGSVVTGVSDITGSVTPAGSFNNLIGTGGSGGLVNGTTGNLVGVANPKLGGLSDNGGPTLTVPLLRGSPALDAGSDALALTTDQRGAQRGSAASHAGAHTDIGAYEASSSYLVTSAADSTTRGTLRAAIAWANTNINAAQAAVSAPNLIGFDTRGTFATAQTILLDPTLGTLALATQTGGPESIVGPTATTVTLKGGGSATNFSVLSVSPATTATLANLTITGGNATNGGGIDNNGALSVSNSTFSGNTAQHGGGIFTYGAMTLNNSTLSGNSATDFGGGIDNYGALSVSNSTLSGNSAVYFGGDIENIGTMTVTGSTLCGNSSSYGGGGISNYADADVHGTLSLIDSTLSGNLAIFGGGIINYGTLSVSSSTLTGNSAPRGGGLWIPSGAVTLVNTIVAGNTERGATTANDIGGTIVAANSFNNLFGTGGAGGLTNGFNGNLVGVSNPGLGTLGNYGGPTQTIPLLPNSPAINAGNNILIASLTDQRGYARIVYGTIDIGAVESSSFPITPSASSPRQGPIVGTAFGPPSTVTATSPSGGSVAGGTVLFSDLTGSAAGPTVAAINAVGIASTTAAANRNAGPSAVTASTSSPSSIAIRLTHWRPRSVVPSVSLEAAGE